MITFTRVIDGIGLVVEAVGVAAIVVGLSVAAFRYLRFNCRSEEGFQRLRHDIGRGILVGLEFLVAADIIRTVAIAPNMENVTVLGMIVLIRTFLSFAIEIELNGNLPWRSGNQRSDTH